MLEYIHLKNCRAELKDFCGIGAPSLKAIKEVIENDTVKSDRNTLTGNLVKFYTEPCPMDDDYLGLDTGDREILVSMLGRKFGGGTWPRYADGEQAYDAFISKFTPNARAAGWTVALI